MTDDHVRNIQSPTSISGSTHPKLLASGQEGKTQTPKGKENFDCGTLRFKMGLCSHRAAGEQFVWCPH